MNKMVLLEVPMESTWSEMGLQLSLLGGGVLLLWITQLLTPEPKRVRVRVKRSRTNRNR